jgi:hypothetical protein
VLLIVVVIVMGLGIVSTLLTMSLPLVLLVGFFFLVVLAISLYTLTESVALSDAEINVRRLWIARSLRWGEIHRVHGTMRGLKLKNFDEDVSVSISSQLPGYEEVIEEIGRRRPDLFSSPENFNLDRHPAVLGLGVLAGLALLGLGAWLAWDGGEMLFSGLIVAAIGLFLAGGLLFSVRAVVLEGDALTLKYLFKETTWRAREIADVGLDFQRTRNGRMYFVRLTLANRKSVRLSSLRCGPALAYLVLKEWRRKHAAAEFSV